MVSKNTSSLNPSLENAGSSALNKSFIIYRLMIFNCFEPYLILFLSRAIGPMVTEVYSFSFIFTVLFIFYL